MKNLFFLIVMLVFGFDSHGQVKTFSGSLAEAVQQANKEGKQVLAMLSSTTCAPCKAIVANILPLENVGKYINDRYIFLKYVIDEADPDYIQKTYGVSSYPTFLFLDKDAKEFSRTSGGAATAEIFIEKLENAKFDPLAKLRENFIAAPAAYGDEYIKSLSKVGDKRKVKEVYETLFYTYDADTFFDKYFKNIQTYFDLNSDVITYLMDNHEWAVKQYGDEASSLVKKLASNQAWMLAHEKDYAKKVELLDNLTSKSKKYPFIKGAVTEFALQNTKKILSIDIASLSKNLLKQSGQLTDLDKQSLLLFIAYLAKQKDYNSHKPILTDTAKKLSTTLKVPMDLTQLLH